MTLDLVKFTKSFYLDKLKFWNIIFFIAYNIIPYKKSIIKPIFLILYYVLL
jgi:hypothetical protein